MMMETSECPVGIIAIAIAIAIEIEIEIEKQQHDILKKSISIPIAISIPNKRN